MSREPSRQRTPSTRSTVPCPPSTPPSRSRRRLLALAAGGGLLATSGCLSALGSSGESNVSTGLGLDRLEYEAGFGAEAASLAETYGEHGVWGLADGLGVDGPTYVGARRDSLAVPHEPDGEGEGDGRTGEDGENGEHGEDGENGENGESEPRWLTADGAALVYRLSGTYRVWLWAGARARQPDSGLGRSSLTRLSVGAVAGDGWELVDFAPRGASREGPVSVSLDDRGPAGRTPLPGGGIGVDEGSRTGPDGRVGVAWQGIARGIRSVNAVCAFRPTGNGADPPFDVRVSVGVAGGRGVL